MSRAVPRIYGAREAADVIGVAVQNLHAVAGLPAPVVALAATKVWRAEEIDAFAVEYRARRAARGRSPLAAA